ncbi:hypothetical protein KY321_00475 [Candidatus Woesearchaeota archaeon]|nr:hypothetical protein [Candidatus Woesearchaeota archaeon]
MTEELKCSYCKKPINQDEDYNVGLFVTLHNDCYKLAFVDDKTFKGKWFRFRNKFLYNMYVLKSFIVFVYVMIRLSFKRKRK